MTPIMRGDERRGEGTGQRGGSGDLVRLVETYDVLVLERVQHLCEGQRRGGVGERAGGRRAPPARGGLTLPDRGAGGCGGAGSTELSHHGRVVLLVLVELLIQYLCRVELAGAPLAHQLHLGEVASADRLSFLRGWGRLRRLRARFAARSAGA